ncbi:hypothetical protein [Burkholderia stagnalis]|uniref:hypothetical protein n=1 Tax=Burkholderia stagnalis TaxID=1503054 RepID=UPI000F560FBA|nr:hypothetical protein [Burkholderia stagnalis]
MSRIIKQRRNPVAEFSICSSPRPHPVGSPILTFRRGREHNSDRRPLIHPGINPSESADTLRRTPCCATLTPRPALARRQSFTFRETPYLYFSSRTRNKIHIICMFFYLPASRVSR